MLILAIDTSLEVAAACLYDSVSAAEIAAERVRLARGHDEILLNLVERVIGACENGFSSLDRIAVTVGPGSFTGLRIGVSAARAFGLVAEVPVVGVSTLAAFAAPALRAGGSATVIAAVDARHGRVFAQTFGPDGRIVMPAQLISVADVVRKAGASALRLVGSGAPLLAIEAWRRGHKAEVEGDLVSPEIGFVARLGALADPATAPPRPLYLKAAEVTLAAPIARAQDPELEAATS